MYDSTLQMGELRLTEDSSEVSSFWASLYRPAPARDTGSGVLSNLLGRAWTGPDGVNGDH